MASGYFSMSRRAFEFAIALQKLRRGAVLVLRHGSNKVPFLPDWRWLLNGMKADAAENFYAEVGRRRAALVWFRDTTERIRASCHHPPPA